MKKIAVTLAFASLTFFTAHVQAAGKLPPLPVKQLEALKARQNAVQAALKTAKPEQADKLLLQYSSQLAQLKVKVAQADARFLEKHYPKHIKANDKLDERKITYKSPALKARERELAQYGLQYSYYPPVGYGYLELDKNHYRNLFKGKLTPAAQAYLDLRHEQSDQSPYYDQEFDLAYQTAGERLIAWERYLNKYGSQSSLLNHAKCEYLLYQQLFLTGGYSKSHVGGEWGMAGITEDVHNPEAKLQSEVREAWQDYRKKYPQSATSLLIEQMPKKPPYQDVASKIVLDYQQKIGLLPLAQNVCDKLTI